MDTLSNTLVTGATGVLGGTVLKRLAEASASPRPAVRAPERYQPPAGVAAAARFDYERPETIAPALDGIERLVLIARPLDAAADRVMTPVIDAAVEAGLAHVTLCTAFGIDRNEAAPLRKVEHALERSGLRYSIVRPNFFMDNFSAGMFSGMIRETNAIMLPAGDAKTAFIAADDIAAVILATLTDPRHAGRSYDLSGPAALDHDEVAAAISAVSGRQIAYKPISEGEMTAAVREQGMAEPSVGLLVNLMRLTRDGFFAAVTDDVARVTGQAPVSFDQFARVHAAAWRS